MFYEIVEGDLNQAFFFLADVDVIITITTSSRTEGLAAGRRSIICGLWSVNNDQGLFPSSYQ